MGNNKTRFPDFGKSTISHNNNIAKAVSCLTEELVARPDANIKRTKA